MSPEIGELVAALPDGFDEEKAPDEALQTLLSSLANKPVPVGRLTRFWALGSLKAKIALAYMAWWLRSGYVSGDKRAATLNETHLKSAIKLLGTMSYLRGSIMKIGQTLANYPDVVPDEFVDTLSALHFEAPPMHFSLLREQVRNELGRDPEEIFDEFETKAFAAASLGQVHRARLKTGQEVAVKIQYPNIARTIRDDFKNFNALLLPMRLTKDWDNFRAQGEDIFETLELETDYVNEAECLKAAREAFNEDDGVVVPEVFEEFSSGRVLTMEFIEGKHVDEFMATNPPQEVRDRHGHQIFMAISRLYYGLKIVYADPHPGNFYFMEDGRLGLIDFGCCYRFTDETWKYCANVERASHGPIDSEAMDAALLYSVDLTDEAQMGEERLGLLRDYCTWMWEPMQEDAPFDFGDPEYLRRGMQLYGDMIRKRYTRSQPINTWLARSFVGARAMAYRLRAKFNLKAILDTETSVK